LSVVFEHAPRADIVLATDNEQLTNIKTAIDRFAANSIIRPQPSLAMPVAPPAQTFQFICILSLELAEES
jgi:hypothetical protein